jgi:hypothetical protein
VQVAATVPRAPGRASQYEGVPVTVAGRADEAAAPLRRAAPALPRRTDAPGTELQLLVLAVDLDHLGAVDLASGALVRAWARGRFDPRLRPYDVVAVTLGVVGDEVPDPAEPEAVVLADGPEPIGRLGGRRVERYLRPLVHPPDQPLLGCHAPTVPFWERTADHPSIAVVEPERPAIVARRGDGLACWFGWRGTVVHFPFMDRRVSQMMGRDGLPRLAAPRGQRLVVALTPPISGHCHKVVAGLLPRP